MKLKIVKPIEFDKNGEPIFIPSCTAANDNWIRAARLKKKADAGDKAAKQKLKKMHNTKMVQIEFD